ncbi:hypothetical protein EYV94_10315 [Puteibacter caeruleilacunae]|nr:hypothetical protein EYV94_10315 [Puteibacter caeruleilacunae]
MKSPFGLRTKNNNTMNHTIKENTAEEFSKLSNKAFNKKSDAIAARVRYTLAQYDWEVDYFAELMGEPVPLVYEWLSGSNDLSILTIIKMETVLEINLTHCDAVPKPAAGHLDKSTEQQIDQAIEKYKATRDMTTYKEQLWLSRYITLVDYARKNGNADLPTKSKDQQSMGYWIGRQRKKIGNNTIEPDREELLKLIGFNSRLKELLDWDEMFEKLVEYKNKYGNVSLSEDIVGSQVYTWYHNQRHMYWQGKLDYDRLRRFREIGIDMKHQTLNLWLEKFIELVAFKNKNGHCKLRKSLGASQALIAFAQRQRRYKNTIPADRVRKLNQIGFIWGYNNLRSSLNRERGFQHWMERYDELKSYKEEFGTCSISKKNKPYRSLWAWISEQRRRRRDLSKEQVKLLKEIDFFTDHKIDF